MRNCVWGHIFCSIHWPQIFSGGKSKTDSDCSDQFWIKCSAYPSTLPQMVSTPDDVSCSTLNWIQCRIGWSNIVQKLLDSMLYKIHDKESKNFVFVFLFAPFYFYLHIECKLHLLLQPWVSFLFWFSPIQLVCTSEHILTISQDFLSLAFCYLILTQMFPISRNFTPPWSTMYHPLWTTHPLHLHL